jgi:glucose-1-phosphate adenylyltransferase
VRFLTTWLFFANFQEFESAMFERPPPASSTTSDRDVGDLEAYHAAHMDLLGLKPRFDTFNPDWPIYSDHYFGPEARIISGEIRNCIIGGGTVVKGGNIRNSVIRHEVMIEPDVDIEDCIIMDYSFIGSGSRLRRAIIGRYNLIEPATVIGYLPHLIGNATLLARLES